MVLIIQFWNNLNQIYHLWTSHEWCRVRQTQYENTISTRAPPNGSTSFDIWIFSLPRDRMKLHYVRSQRIRKAVEIPFLWKHIILPFYDQQERNSIRRVLMLCGEKVKQLSFFNLSILIEDIKECTNLVHLSLPSTKICVSKLKTVTQSMKKLKYLDILWSEKFDIKLLVMIKEFTQK